MQNPTTPELTMQARVDGEGDPLVLVPGGLTGWNSWEPFVETFIAKNRKVIRVQLLNVQYGLDNKLLPYDYSVKTESEALAATLDSLEIKRAVDVVAWSFGAFTSLDFALDNPERIKTLTLIEPPAIWILDELGNPDDDAIKAVNFFNSLQGEITEDMLETFLNEAGFMPSGKSAREHPQWPAWVPYRQSLRNSPAVVEFKDKLERLKNFPKPVLLLKGTESASFLHKIIDGLNKNLPDVRVLEMPSGHAPHIVSRNQFLIELENFQKQY